jgi:serine/threonine-protein kinase
MNQNYEGLLISERYRVERLLGSGGMGSVYLGQHIGLGKKIAIKLLHANHCQNEQIVSRFQREARMLAQLQHENIVDVLDIGVLEAGEPYLVMEYLSGESLGDLLGRAAPLGLELSCSIVVPILCALSASHECGIVHRDLKPANIFLAQGRTGGPIVKVIDFGVSKLLGATEDEADNLTSTGLIVGTPAYMSPEQARGEKDLDHRSDIYAIGLILYEMLTGKRPFEESNVVKILLRRLTEPPLPPSVAYAGFPKVVEPILEKALKKEADERYQSAQEMIADLDRLVPLSGRLSQLSQYGVAMPSASCATGYLGEVDTVSASIYRRHPSKEAAPLPTTWFSELPKAKKEAVESVVRFVSSVPKWLIALVAAIALLILVVALKSCLFAESSGQGQDAQRSRAYQDGGQAYEGEDDPEFLRSSFQERHGKGRGKHGKKAKAHKKNKGR